MASTMEESRLTGVSVSTRPRHYDSQLLAEYRDGNEEALAQQQTRLHLHSMLPCQLLLLVLIAHLTPKNQALLGHEIVVN